MHAISRKMMKQSLKICPKKLVEGLKEDSCRICVNVLLAPLAKVSFFLPPL